MMRRTRVIPYLCVFVLLLAFVSVPALAVPPINDNISSALMLFGPSASGTITDIDEADLEADEPTASCASDGTDNDSIWFRFSIPDGSVTITIETVEALFDAVVTLYALPFSGQLEELVEIACDSDAAGGDLLLNETLSNGLYVVRVANDDGLPLAFRSINYNFTYTPLSAGLVPVNDSRATATQVVFNKLTKTKRFEYASREADDPITVSCDGSFTPQQTLWYTFTGAKGQTIVSAEGSTLGFPYQAYVNPPRLAVYKLNGLLLEEAACDTGDGLNGAGRVTLNANEADVYFVMVYHSSFSSTMTTASTAKLLVSPKTHDVLVNGNFSAGLDDWTVKNASGDGIVTGVGTPNGSNAFQFVGGPNESTQIKQRFVVPPTLFVPVSILNTRISTRSLSGVPPAGSLKLELIVSFADGSTVKFKSDVLFTNILGNVTNSSASFVLERKGATSILYRLKNKATSGDLMVDDLELEIKPLSATRSTSVLPLPAAPGGR